MHPLFGTVGLLAIAASFFVSSAAGMGGSLILVPVLGLALGTKQGIALAALLLAANNVVKVIAYRKALPIRRLLIVLAAVSLGAALGARLLVSAPSRLVGAAVVISFAVALIAQRSEVPHGTAVLPPLLAFGSGATSGFSGTSGPLKGVAVKGLALDRVRTAGAAAVVSLVGDASKSAVFADAKLLDGGAVMAAVAAVPLMIIATFAGRRFNFVIGERGYDRLFWGVVGAYAIRVVLEA